MAVKINKYQHQKNNVSLRQFAGRSTLVVAACAMVLGLALPAHADSFDEQIKQLQSAQNVDQQSVDSLQGKANDLTTQINNLQQQIASTQAQININQSQYDDLGRQIVAAQKELDHQRAVLGQNIKAMYLEGKVSTVEMLASSKDISQYLDKQEYRDSVKDKITTTVKQIADLKKDLNNKQVQTQQLLESQTKLKDNLAVQQGQANGLLSQTNADKDQFQQSISQKSDQIVGLRAAQAAANRALGGRASYGAPGGGGYPGVWANAPKDSMADTWRMYNRECVSYTAYKASLEGGDATGWGNANQWPGAARANGVPVDGNPRAGDVAISMSGAYGHAMYVEGVSGNTIYVSQYNYELEGLYSTMSISASGLYFIHFR